ncbi:MAG: hypothetical protein R2882_09335 [Gemmatimonadales bacterium]
MGEAHGGLDRAVAATYDEHLLAFVRLGVEELYIVRLFFAGTPGFRGVHRR